MQQQQRTEILRASIAEEQRKLAEARRAFVAEPCADEMDSASFHENIHVVTIFMQRAQQRLRHLERSVDALNTLAPQCGNMCQECGEEIAPARLLARPDALRCTHCQQEWEAEQRRELGGGHGSELGREMGTAALSRSQAWAHMYL